MLLILVDVVLTTATLNMAFFAKEKYARLQQKTKQEKGSTPPKINMEHNHGGSVQIIFPFSQWVICRFQPLIFQGFRTNYTIVKVDGATRNSQNVAIRKGP